MKYCIVLENRYEYDAFGTPYKGDLSGGMNYGYTGKPFDATTGMYNYGYRDYQPSIARFTTVDPVRDGSNWFAYVNNDPVNWVDPWGLSASEKKAVVILSEKEQQTLARDMPIMPIQEGIYTVVEGGEYGERPAEVIDGRTTQPFHNGVDFAAAEGTPVRSTFSSGIVKNVIKNDPVYGNTVIVKHNENLQTQYSHLNTIIVNVGDIGTGGQVIGTVGSTGMSTGAHLHYEVQNENGVYLTEIQRSGSNMVASELPETYSYGNSASGIIDFVKNSAYWPPSYGSTPRATSFLDKLFRWTY
jgi:RHS repeat-associated protein